jgi:exopolysaccharide biosynthesis predicted pyruvyltransferase EpsI
MLWSTVSRFVERRQPYALVDFPNHSNVGDSAIWLGEVKLLRSLAGRPASYVCDYSNFDAAKLCETSGPIFIHGGGNLGDLWPEHQAFRERIVSEFRDRQIIQLPQTIHFTDPKVADNFARAVSQHPNFRLMVRDEPSRAFARSNFECEVILAPDSAIFLNLSRIGSPTHDTVLLLRTDKEKGTIPAGLAGHITDWLVDAADLEAQAEKHIRRVCHLSLRRRRSMVPDDYVRARFDGLARARVNRGMALLSSGRTVITDRLHGHILCALAGIPHRIIDNNYGKVIAYYRQWMKDIPGGSIIA